MSSEQPTIEANLQRIRQQFRDLGYPQVDEFTDDELIAGMRGLARGFAEALPTAAEVMEELARLGIGKGDAEP